MMLARMNLRRCTRRASPPQGARSRPGRTWPQARFLALIGAALIAAGCDAPAPPAPVNPATLAAQHGIDAGVARRLVAREPLAADEVDTLASSGKRDLLVLLMAHPSTPPAALSSFAGFHDDAVRAAVAGNASTPVETLRALRTTGAPSPINRALAMNPSTPVALLLEMRANGEAGDVSLAANLALPADTMEDILRRGDELARLTLARNPALPTALRERLTQDASDDVRRAARTGR